MTQSQTETATCYGVHPETGKPCVLGEHKGHHETDDGLQWLDE